MSNLKIEYQVFFFGKQKFIDHKNRQKPKYIQEKKYQVTNTKQKFIGRLSNAKPWLHLTPAEFFNLIQEYWPEKLYKNALKLK